MPRLSSAASSSATAVSDSIRDPWLPTGAIAQTCDRFTAGQGALAITSGTLRLAAGLVLPANRQVTTITVVSASTALVTGSNQWFALFSKARAKLGVTNDDTSTAWAASTAKTLTLATPYTPTADEEVYVGVLVVATTPPTLQRDAGSNSTAAALAPAMGGNSNTSLTNPASCPSTAAAISAPNFGIYAYVS